MLDKPKLRIQLKLRLKKLQKKLEEKNLDSFLVSAKTNRFYLTGWKADAESGFLLITPQEEFLITDSRYTEHATKQTDFSIIETNEGLGPALKDLATRKKLKNLGFEAQDIPIISYQKLKEYLPGTRLISETFLIEELRKIKDSVELESVKKACTIADKAFTHVRGFIKPKMREDEVAWEMERYMRVVGATRMAWDPFIVAAGKNASMAHWGASAAKIKKEDMVQLDYGCEWDGYTCDMSRVVFMGKPKRKQKEVYNLVFDAQEFGLNLVSDGTRAQEIDKKVHGFIEKRLPSWLSSDFIYKHSLGHGVGIDVHELPYVSFMRESVLEEGNVITIEPGIYIPGFGGVRIEDTVFVTKTGYRSLTKSPKKLTQIVN